MPPPAPRRPGRSARGRGRFIGLILLAGSVAGSAAAAQWAIEPRVSWALNYNSNLLLTPDGQSTGGTTLSLDSTFKRATETTEFDLQPHVDVQRFFSDSTLNAVNFAVQGAFTAHGERSSLGVSAGYERASTLVTELSDTGIIDANTRRETSSFGLTLGRDLSEAQHLDLQGNYTDVAYPDGESSGLVGFHNPSVTLTDTWQYSQRVSLNAGGFGQWVSSPASGYEAHTEGLRVGWTMQVTQRTKLALSGAYSRTTTGGFEQYGSLWDIHGTHNTEVTQWDLEWSRTLQPSGSGFLIRRDSLNLSAQRRLSERVDATLTLQQVQNDNLEGGGFSGVSRYLSSDTGLTFHLTERVALSLTGGIAESRQTTGDATVHGWHTALTTTWTPVPRSISR